MGDSILKLKVELLQEQLKDFDGKSSDSVKNIKEELDSLKETFSYLSDDILTDADKKLKKMITNIDTKSDTGIQALNFALGVWQKQIAELSKTINSTTQKISNVDKASKYGAKTAEIRKAITGEVTSAVNIGPKGTATRVGVGSFVNKRGEEILYPTYNELTLKQIFKKFKNVQDILDIFERVKYSDLDADVVDTRLRMLKSKLAYLDVGEFGLQPGKDDVAIQRLNTVRSVMGIAKGEEGLKGSQWDVIGGINRFELLLDRIRTDSSLNIDQKNQKINEILDNTAESLKKMGLTLDEQRELISKVDRGNLDTRQEVNVEGNIYTAEQYYSNLFAKVVHKAFDFASEQIFDEEMSKFISRGEGLSEDTKPTAKAGEFVHRGRLYQKDVFELEEARQRAEDERRMEELNGKPQVFKDIPFEDRATTDEENLSMFSNRLGRIIDFSQRIDKSLKPTFEALQQTDETFRNMDFGNFVEQFIANLPDENLARTLFERYKRSQEYWEKFQQIGEANFKPEDFLKFFETDKYGIPTSTSDEEAAIYSELSRLVGHGDVERLGQISEKLNLRFKATQQNTFASLLTQLMRGDTFGAMHAKTTVGSRGGIDYTERDGFSTIYTPREYGKGAAESYYEKSPYQRLFEEGRVLDNTDLESEKLKEAIENFTNQVVIDTVNKAIPEKKELPPPPTDKDAPPPPLFDRGDNLPAIQSDGDIIVQSSQPIEVTAEEVKADSVDSVVADVDEIQRQQGNAKPTKKRRGGGKKKDTGIVQPPSPFPPDDNKIYDVHLRGKNIFGPEIKQAQKILEDAGYIIRSIRANDVGEFIGFDLGKKSKRGKGTVDARTTNKKLLEALEQHLFPQVDRIDKNVDSIAKNGIKTSGGAGVPSSDPPANQSAQDSDPPWEYPWGGWAGSNSAKNKGDSEAQQESRKREYVELLRKQYAYQLEINKLEQEAYIAEKKGDATAVENRQKRIDGLIKEQDLLREQSEELYGTLSAKHKKAVDEEERIQQIRLKTQSNLAGYTGAGAFGAQTGTATVTVEDQAQAEKEYEKALNDVLRIQKQIYATKHQADVSTGKEKQVNEALIPILQEQLNISAQQVKNLEKSNLLRPKQMKAIQAQFELDMATAEAQEKTRKGGAGNLFDVIANDVRRATMRITDFGLAAKALNSIPQSIQRVKQLTGQLEEALMNLRVVAELNREEGEALILTYAKMGKELGESTTGIAASANEWLNKCVWVTINSFNCWNPLRAI